MPQYYSTFPTGFEPAIEEFIARDLPGTQVVRLMDGAVEYRRRGQLAAFPPWFNNTFLCLTTFPRAPKDPIQDMVRLALQRGIDSDMLAAHLPPSASGFRAMFMVDGLLTHAGLKTMAKAEEFLTIHSGLTPSRARPDVEFWFLYRREGIGFLLMRLTQPRDPARQQNPGELRPDIAHLLCRLSNPKPDDVFLDPFAGYGSVTKARLAVLAASVTAMDNSSPDQLRNALRSPSVEVLKMDGLNMETIKSGSVDAIVTALPEQTPPDSAAAFLGKFASEAYRVLKKDGRLVMLTTAKAEAEASLKKGLAVDGRLDVLVSGKKAAVFICRKVK